MRYINLIFKYSFFMLLAGNVFLFFYKPPLPAHTELLPEIKNEPAQEPTALDDIQTMAEGHAYTLEPKYSYDIYGLVVSLYDSDSWLDLAHKNDPKNVRDLCIVWGENAASDGYREIEYKSGEFTCFYRWRGQKPDFNPQALSNNHIIPQNAGISNIVRDVNIGDQIHIKGYLVNYSVKTPEGRLAGKRTTSTSRDDTGNGACEVVYVENIEILKRGNPGYYAAKQIAKHGAWSVLILWILLNVVASEIKKYKKDETKVDFMR